MTNSREWRQLESIKIELPKDTLVLAEKLDEYRGLVRQISLLNFNFFFFYVYYLIKKG